MLGKYRDTKSGSDVLNTGPGAIDFLHNLWRKTGSLK
jgi:hypothetical protein